jgi:hypothetical protein
MLTTAHPISKQVQQPIDPTLFIWARIIIKQVNAHPERYPLLAEMLHVKPAEDVVTQQKEGGQ